MSSDTLSSSSEGEEGDKEDTFAKVQPLQGKWKCGQMTVKKVDSDMLIEFHQS